MSVLADFNTNPNNEKTENRLLVKGAANMVLDRCTHVKYRDGSVSKISGSMRRDLEAKITDMATRPLRCLALATKDASNLPNSLKDFKPGSDNEIREHPLLQDPNNYENIESGLTLVGLVGIKDPARPEVAESIQKCTEAGIRVIMITGDARDTAVAIAKEINIFKSDDDESGLPLKAFEGQEFFLKPRNEQISILSKDNIVFCRAQPSDKQALIKMLQQDLNEIPAMTGDGVNDAPALQQAAIGVAMGTGTAVSKEASDMVLADDNFSTIVSAVEEGRTIYANMQAFICFLISCNIGEICAIFFATLLGFPEPLTAMHLLWVNLVTDGPPATALGFNPPSPNSMKERPRPSDEPIMTKWLLVRYLLTGLYVGVATIGVFAQHYLRQGISLSQLSRWSKCGKGWMPPPVTLFTTTKNLCSSFFREEGRRLPQTLSLTTLVCMEMLKALSAVSVNDSVLRVPPWKNKWLLMGVAGPFLLHLAVLYSSSLGFPGFGRAFGMVSASCEA
jgi:Ca2+-transporting ATPase